MNITSERKYVNNSIFVSEKADKMERQRRKYRQILLSDKANIVRRLEAGERVKDLAKEYSVSESTISHIKKQKEAIVQKHLQNSCIGNKENTRLGGGEHSALEEALFKWFCQMRSLGEPISGPLLREQALLFHAKLGSTTSFSASNGWLHRFKQRHGIRHLSLQGEKVTSNTEASVDFCTEFSKLIEEGRYKLDNIYNADETGLAWKSLPCKTAAAKDEKQHRATVMTCANSTGTDKIPLLVIGKSPKPRWLKNIGKLPVAYRGQRKAWIDTDIFKDWYTTVFLPHIKTKQGAEQERFLLLLDNAPCHPSADELNAIDDCCQVVILPPNVTALIQPMDQGVIEAIRKEYRNVLLRQLLLAECQDEQAISDFLKTWTMLSCCQSLAQAWDNVTVNTLRNAWNNLIGRFEEIDTASTPGNHQEDEISSLVNRLKGCGDLSAEDAAAWLNEDASQPAWRVLSNDELLKNVDPLMDISPPSSEDEAEDLEGVEEPPRITAREALTALNTFQQWFQTRWESELQDLVSLNRIRETTEKIVLNL